MLIQNSVWKVRSQRYEEDLSTVFYWIQEKCFACLRCSISSNDPCYSLSRGFCSADHAFQMALSERLIVFR